MNWSQVNVDPNEQVSHELSQVNALLGERASNERGPNQQVSNNLVSSERGLR